MTIRVTPEMIKATGKYPPPDPKELKNSTPPTIMSTMPMTASSLEARRRLGIT
jgi:hypothetical protein